MFRKLPTLLISSLLLAGGACASGLYIEKFHAGVNPTRINGVYKSFVEFDVRPLGLLENASVSCFNWADTPDMAISSLADAPCVDDHLVSFAFQLVTVQGIPVPPQATDTAGVGFRFDVVWKHSTVEMKGSRTILLSEVVWATAEGQTVQVYNGPHEFVV